MTHMSQHSPARLTLIVFALIICFFTALLMMPIMHAGTNKISLTDAFFTATSAICVTGLTTVNTATNWSFFGHIVIMFAMMIGGLGIMTLASFLGTRISRHTKLSQRLILAQETKSTLGEVGLLIKTVLLVSLIGQFIIFLLLLPFFHNKGDALISAVWHALFTSVSIFNNAGFTILPEGFTPYIDSFAFSIPLILGTFIGALGFPVILDVARNKIRRRKWNLTTHLTLIFYPALFILGAVVLLGFEWTNPLTLGASSIIEKLNATFVLSADARSSGISTIDISNLHQSSLLFLDALMFIGGGSASTAGGIKVTTFAVIIIALIAEARGNNDSEFLGKRLPTSTLRLAISVVILGAVTIGIGTLALLHITGLELSTILFEVISAFSTCGLSTGITATLPLSGKWVLIMLMFIGRTGTITLAAALALRTRKRAIRFPEERPIIG
ncbi:MAG: TrkH family potassium uptake protein [Actinomycetaceae bacterium]|nr:TrkH family potassium uptake protein [Actinomycetaceae bacterium]